MTLAAARRRAAQDVELLKAYYMLEPYFTGVERMRREAWRAAREAEAALAEALRRIAALEARMAACMLVCGLTRIRKQAAAAATPVRGGGRSAEEEEADRARRRAELARSAAVSCVHCHPCWPVCMLCVFWGSPGALARARRSPRRERARARTLRR